jgi:hypothetical protein
MNKRAFIEGYLSKRAQEGMGGEKKESPSVVAGGTTTASSGDTNLTNASPVAALNAAKLNTTATEGITNVLPQSNTSVTSQPANQLNTAVSNNIPADKKEQQSALPTSEMRRRTESNIPSLV